MIGLLTGTVYAKDHNPILLTIGGVGYNVHIPLHLATHLVLGATTTLYIHTHVREDALDLYGFTTPEELRLFELLLSVSGIGPRTALAIVDNGAPAIQKAIQMSDVDFFTEIPRLGKKNAQKIIIELKSKLGSLTELDLDEDSQSQSAQILSALTGMGFAKQEVLAVLKDLNKDTLTMEQKMRLALKRLGS